MLAHARARGVMITPSDPATSHRPRAARERVVETRSAHLATALSRLAIAAASARGRYHEVNEDSHSALDGIAPVFVVADGVGGGAMASWASKQLVAGVHRRLERARIDAGAIREALLDADRSIGKGIAHHSATTGAATVALCAGSGALRSRWWIAWVGDCRIYRIGMGSDAPAQLLTRDDTYRHLGEEPPAGGSLDDPARMIGNGAVSAPNIAHVDLGWNEMLMLCSDGVHKHVDPREIAQVLRASTPLSRRCLRLVEIAEVNGGQDDATVLVVHRDMQPRARLAGYASGVLVVLAAVSLVLLWPDAQPGWQSSSPPAQSSRIQSESAP